mgnify:CR=1 FL=1
MFCPKCRSEFEPGYTECARCEAELVDELPPPPKPEYNDLATVLVAPNETILMLAKSRLEAEGIPCFTTNNTQDLFGLGRIAGYNLVTGPQELQVPPEDLERAIGILETLETLQEGQQQAVLPVPECGEGDGGTGDSSGGIMCCPDCGAECLAESMECPECGAALAEEPPSELHPECVNLRTVLIAPDENVLMVAKSRLEAEGIPCFTTNNVQDLVSGRIAGYCLAMGPQELQVPAEDAERATAILESISDEEAEEEKQD